MLIIIGLGNPGEKYNKTRHNTGFMFIDRLYQVLSEEQSFSLKPWKLEAKTEGWVAEVSRGTKKTFLLKPNTFMNLSGVSVQKFVNFYKDGKTAEKIIAFDDLDLELGVYKIQEHKFPRGHKGVNSIVEKFPKEKFVSIRIGTNNRAPQDKGKPSPEWGEDFILRPMAREELSVLMKSIDAAIIDFRAKFKEYLSK